ncbi:hypothetical protein PHLCEN_2v11957 [Hermanssonia centrifuga]|uniref:Uncharacterized protein n=1 Tax=Hermanssonia centrifuga TaxID=98765 RepID=A0A2R6NIE3_9APHY|nr:hypothetical protein PHLCEN_2v11957 [Hermanssonia centrifuga]
MSSAIPPPLPSPGVGARRKGPKSLPKLPLSAFTPPNTGTSDQFPLAPSPSSIQPVKIIDAHVVAQNGDLSRWVQEAGQALGGRMGGVVLALTGAEPAEVEKTLEILSSTPPKTPVLAVLVPYSLEQGAPTDPPAYLTPEPSSGPKIILSAVYTKYSPQAVDALQWALEKGFTVDIDIETNLRAGEGAWEDLEEFLVKAIPQAPKGKIILSNILPPPDDLSLPIVKLLTHPTYQDYQSQTAALSLYANVSIKFLPPSWGSPTPASGEVRSADTLDKKEWKRRIKMYIGPAVEAFGYERIVFGSSPSPSSRGTSNAGDWFELARESFAELGTEQEDIDAVFFGNAQRVYSL